MQQYCWNVFAKTGSIEAYLLLKEYEATVGYDRNQEQVAEGVAQNGSDCDQVHRLR